MSRNELIAVVVILLFVLLAVNIPAFLSAKCRTDALNAGKSTEEISKICNQIEE